MTTLAPDLPRPSFRGPLARETTASGRSRWSGTIRTGLPQSPRALLHASRALYIDHVERHFACDAALRALHFAVPRLVRCSEFASPRALVRALRCDDRHPSSEAVLAGYRDAAEQTLLEAGRLGWVFEPEPKVSLALATSGLLAVVQRGVLRTLFFPGLPRVDDEAASACARTRRERAWTPEEHHYYRVFRPAVQLIRSMPDDAVAGRVSQYGALKRVLPRAAELRLEHWLGMRSVEPHGFNGGAHGDV